MAEADVLEVRNVGFVATRLCGTDGVSLEVGKWTSILEHLEYDCFFICGKSDRPAERSFLIEEGDYLHPTIQAINQQVFGNKFRNRQLSQQIRAVANRIKDEIYRAIEQFSLDLLIAENSLTIPLNISLGAALLEVLMETGLPCIAHHHDFFWERERFLVNSADDYFDAVFPPQVANIDHVVINSLAGEEFGRRTGMSYHVIPNVMDFAHPPGEPDDYAADFRRTIGVDQNDFLILQPSRVVARKGIEHSIELIKRLDDSRCKLVITHDGNDEGNEYPERIRQYAKMLGVEIIFVEQFVSYQRGTGSDGSKKYSIWDVYPHADLVAYPSTYEGFGNAFLEAVYYRRPIFCNRYAIFRTDIEPCGFQPITMDGYLTDEAVAGVRRVLTDRGYREEMVEQNYRAARKYYSYERVEHELRAILDRPQPRHELCQCEPGSI